MRTINAGFEKKGCWETAKHSGFFWNTLLGMWYRWIENRLWFPYGLSYFVIAQKNGDFDERYR